MCGKKTPPCLTPFPHILFDTLTKLQCQCRLNEIDLLEISLHFLEELSKTLSVTYVIQCNV